MLDESRDHPPGMGGCIANFYTLPDSHTPQFCIKQACLTLPCERTNMAGGHNNDKETSLLNSLTGSGWKEVP